MKKEIIRTEDAVGKILAHDITRIVKGEFKGSLFKKGHIIAPEDVDRLLEERYMAGKLRRAGGRVRGPKKRTAEQDRCFDAALQALIDQRE
mgnify:CR=1 FL=1